MNWQSYEGVTSLLLACQTGHENSARILLKAGANANIADNMDNFPLHEGTICWRFYCIFMLQKIWFVLSPFLCNVLCSDKLIRM